MKFKETEPTLYVYAPNRTTLYGCAPLPNKLSINYRFNTFSEMSFEIRKYYYDERKEEWVKDLYLQAKKYDIPFCFKQTGTYFETLDGKKLTIERSSQFNMATKLGYQDFKITTL